MKDNFCHYQIKEGWLLFTVKAGNFGHFERFCLKNLVIEWESFYCFLKFWKLKKSLSNVNCEWKNTLPVFLIFDVKVVSEVTHQCHQTSDTQQNAYKTEKDYRANAIFGQYSTFRKWQQKLRKKICERCFILFFFCF